MKLCFKQIIFDVRGAEIPLLSPVSISNCKYVYTICNNYFGGVLKFFDIWQLCKNIPDFSRSRVEGSNKLVMREPHGESAYLPPSQKTSLQGIPIYFYFQLLFLRQGNPMILAIYFLTSSCFQTRSPRHPNVIFFILLSKDKTQVPGIQESSEQPLANSNIVRGIQQTCWRLQTWSCANINCSPLQQR